MTLLLNFLLTNGRDFLRRMAGSSRPSTKSPRAADLSGSAVYPPHMHQDFVGTHRFEVLAPLGKGGFGKVWKVELRKEKKLYAMKEMAKARIISKRSVNSVMNEKKFLCQLQHP